MRDQSAFVPCVSSAFSQESVDRHKTTLIRQKTRILLGCARCSICCIVRLASIRT